MGDCSYKIEWHPSLAPFACHVCNSSLDTHEILVTDHDVRYKIFIYWCENCRLVRAMLRPRPEVIHKLPDTPQQNRPQYYSPSQLIEAYEVVLLFTSR